MLKKWYKKLISHDYEKAKLLTLVKKYLKSGSRILDVGCGYGRYLTPLKIFGYDVLGVEQNSEIVKENNKNGIHCITTDAFTKISTLFDSVILSHIIEHFTPSELFVFLDSYLSKLEKGGYLIIATPLYTSYFYDDFDHVKPYHPQGLQMVFGGNQAQVQYYSSHKMVLKDIWFRKSPYVTTFKKAKYIPSSKTKIWQLCDLILVLVFKITFHAFGKKDGWIGVYQKI